MTDLLISLDPETAAAYEEIDAQAKKELHDFLVSEVKRKLSNQRLSAIMDEMSAQAKANGLTPEILEEILADEA